MSYYGYYQEPRRGSRAEGERAWTRAKATAWDERWHRLSHEARSAYLHQMKPPAREGSLNQPSSPATSIDRHALDELVAAGLARVEPGKGKKPDRVFPAVEAHDFAVRLRAIERAKLLEAHDLGRLGLFVRNAYFDAGLTSINAVLASAKIQDFGPLERALADYVSSGYWPGWAADLVGTEAARSLVAALAKAPGPVRVAEIPGLVPGPKGKEAAKAAEALADRLAVFEGLDPETLDIVAGLLPAVRKRLAEAGRPKVDPPLIACEVPAEVGPIGGIIVGDLRVFLLEVAGQAPRLRQEGGLFVKEEPRFLEALGEWPDWLYQATGVDPVRRVEDVFTWARDLRLTEVEVDEKSKALRLSPKGRAWLASEMEDQYAAIYEWFRDAKVKADPYSYYPGNGDARFLGAAVAIAPARGRGASAYDSYREPKAEDRQAFREAIYRAFAPLKVGVYYRVTSVLEHLAFEGRNPLLAVGEAAKLAIFLEGSPVPPLPEHLAAAARRLISLLLSRRLLPFDALRIAIDGEGNVCVARLPRLDGYFGKPYERDEASGGDATRVIVQPDFSVIVIGLSPAPAAELAPFCERSSGQVGQGALTFKITRASVIRAASQGLSADQIVARLEKHASVGVPANVLREVRDWAGWVRLVNVKPMTIVRCPDAEAADRVASALGRRAERIGEALVALDSSRVSPAERLKLQEQGVIITKDDIAVARKPKAAAPAPAGPAVGKRPRGRPKKAR